MTQRDPDALYRLIPAVYRSRDVPLGQPLRALMRLLGGELATVQGNIDALYDNWFVETCAPWVVPYLGEVLEIEELSQQRLVFDFQRRWVGNTVAWRRRRGVASVLQPLIFGATGWSARSEDAQGRLLVTANLRSPRPDGPGTADVRREVAMSRIGTPFATVPTSARISGFSPPQPPRRPGEGHSGGLGSVEIWVWRLGAFPLEGMSPVPTTVEGQASPAGLYFMQPLGFDSPVFHAPPVAPPAQRVAKPRELTTPLSVEELSLDLDRYRRRYQALTGLEAPANSVYYGPDRGFSLRFDGQRVGPGEVEGEDLESWGRPAAGAWLWLSGELTDPLSLTAEPQLVATFGAASAVLLILDPAATTAEEVAVSLQSALRQQTDPVYSEALVAAVASTVNGDTSRLAICAGVRGASMLFEASPEDPQTVNTLKLTSAFGAFGRGGALGSALAEPVLPNNGLPAEMEVVADGVGPLPISLQRPLTTVTAVADALEAALRGLGSNGAVFANASVLAVEQRLWVIPGKPSTTASGISGITFLATAVDPLTVGAVGLESLIALDPERGRIAFPVGYPQPQEILVDAPYGGVGPIGGGPYPRLAEGVEVQAEGDGVAVYEIGARCELATVNDAYNQWLRDGQPRAVLRICDSATYRFDTVTELTLPPNGMFALEAAAQQRPTLLLANPLRLVPPSEGGLVRFSGLLMSGRLRLSGSGAMRLRVEDCTLLPQREESLIFKPTEPLEEGRWAHSATYIASNKRVLAVGGENGEGAIDQCEVYDLLAEKWVPTGSLLQARSHHTASEVSVRNLGQRVAMIGGKDSAGQALASGELYDPVGGAFSAISGSLQQGRWDHSATLVFTNGKILLAGGRDANGALGSLELYNPFDPEKPFETVEATLNPPRWGHAAVSLNDGTILLAGGENENGPVGTLSIYDPRGNGGQGTVTNLLASLVPPRGGAPALQVQTQSGARVAFFGGAAKGTGEDPEALATVSEWDLQPQGTVRNVAELLQARFGATASLMPDGQVLVIAGEGPASALPGAKLEPLESAEIFNPRTNDSLPTGPLPAARTEHTATTLPGGSVLVVGGRGAGGIALTSCAMTAPGPVVFSSAQVIDEDGSAQGYEVEVQRGLLGALWLSPEAGTVAIADSILQPLAKTVSGNFPPALAASSSGDYGPPATLERSTFLGEVWVSSPIEGTSILCQHGLHVTTEVDGAAASGCLRYSYLGRMVSFAVGELLRSAPDPQPLNSTLLDSLPESVHVYRCQPELALEQVAADLGYESVEELPKRIAESVRRRVRPRFTSIEYPNPAYAQLNLSCDAAITEGGAEGTEMGAYAALRQPQREALLETLARRYLPLGQRVAILYVN
ncbi:MAG: kelch repeat-containing protein [Acidobacteriota bacterium]